MHMPSSDSPAGEANVPITFVLEDPRAVTDSDLREHHLMGSRGQSLLEIALANGLHIEHTCGGVCACSTCHVCIDQGMAHLAEASDEELDQVEEAPGLEMNSRLACQCVIQGPGPITARVPAWNRNAVKETPH